jgi:hypothetical protein
MNSNQAFKKLPLYLIFGVIFLAIGVMNIAESGLDKNVVYTSIYLIVGVILLIGGVIALKKGSRDHKGDF